MASGLRWIGIFAIARFLALLWAMFSELGNSITALVSLLCLLCEIFLDLSNSISSLSDDSTWIIGDLVKFVAGLVELVSLAWFQRLLRVFGLLGEVMLRVCVALELLRVLLQSEIFAVIGGKVLILSLGITVILLTKKELCRYI